MKGGDNTADRCTRSRTIRLQQTSIHTSKNVLGEFSNNISEGFAIINKTLPYCAKRTAIISRAHLARPLLRAVAR